MAGTRQGADTGSRAERELEAWLERARVNPAEEPAFFRRLLDALVHVHVPISDDSGRTRLVQFRHPDGFDAIPFFTAWEKARFASSSAVKIVQVRGRDLFAGTKGATLMMNPNDGGAVLYPEEVAALLDTGFVARIEKTPHIQVHVRPAQSAPAWLADLVSQCLKDTSFVMAAYLLEASTSPPEEQPPGLLIWLVADLAFVERAARLVGTAIQSRGAELDVVVDVTVHDASQPLPEPLADPRILPIFSR